ncbi:MAG: hypothetical protein HYV26_11755 [Candidatus Hydrogenedentes bacterium]|nr:hypothetical protein [Candidatus Hydrogenedentota bacterium]
MIQVSQSDTGQYVLQHPPSQTTIIDASLENGYQRLSAFLKTLPEHQPSSGGETAQASPVPSAGGTSPRFWLLALLVVLPFIWLGVLHYSLASLVTDFQAYNSSEVVERVNTLSAEVDTLRTEVNRLGNEMAARLPAPAAPAAQ